MDDRAHSAAVIGAAIEVHRELGPGLLESVYESGMVVELFEAGLDFVRQHSVPIFYKRALLDCNFRVDFVVEGRLLVELKAVERIIGIHEAQVLTYLKATGLRYGLLLNFNVQYMRQGIRRFALDSR